MKEVQATCGNCLCWNPVELDPAQRLLMIGQPPRGMCFYAPPVAFPVVKNGQEVGLRNIRPITAANEMCYSWIPREGSGEEELPGEKPLKGRGK